MEGMVLLSGSSDTKDPKILRVGRGSGIMSYIPCNAKSPTWLSFHKSTLQVAQAAWATHHSWVAGP